MRRDLVLEGAKAQSTIGVAFAGVQFHISRISEPSHFPILLGRFGRQSIRPRHHRVFGVRGHFGHFLPPSFFFWFFFLCQITLIEPTQPDLAKINTPNPGCKRSNGSQTTNGGRKRRAPWGTGRPTGGHTTQSEAKWIRRAPSDMEVTSVAVELMAPSRFPKQPLLHRPLLLSSPVSVSLSTSNLSVFSALGPPPSSARPQPATSSHQQSNHRLKCRCPFIATSCI